MYLALAWGLQRAIYLGTLCADLNRLLDGLFQAVPGFHVNWVDVLNIDVGDCQIVLCEFQAIIDFLILLVHA